MALLFVRSRWIEMSLFPYAVLLQVTPIVAIAPLIIIWVKDTRTALVLCAVVVAIFPIISNTTLGLRSVDPGLLNMFRMYRATRWQILMRLRVPSALPYFFGGLRIASGLSLIGAVVAEFVAGTGGQGAGLAYQILLAGIQLNIPRLFAALLLITRQRRGAVRPDGVDLAPRAVALARERSYAQRLTSTSSVPHEDFSDDSRFVFGVCNQPAFDLFMDLTTAEQVEMTHAIADPSSRGGQPEVQRRVPVSAQCAVHRHQSVATNA